MRKYYIVVMLLLLFVTGFSSAAAASEGEFIIFNASGLDLYELSIAPANSTAQGPNALNGQKLANGQSLKMVFSNYNAGFSQWDVWGGTCCGGKVKWQQLNLTAVGAITLYEGGRAELN